MFVTRVCVWNLSDAFAQDAQMGGPSLEIDPTPKFTRGYAGKSTVARSVVVLPGRLPAREIVLPTLTQQCILCPSFDSKTQ